MNKTALAIATATILTLPNSVTLAEVTEEGTSKTSTEVVDPSAPVTQEVPEEVTLPTEPEIKPDTETPVIPVVPVSPDTPVEIETSKQPSENTGNADSSNEEPDTAGESENSTGSASNKIPENSGNSVSRPTHSNQVAGSNDGTNKVALTPNTAPEFVNPVNNSESKVVVSDGSSESKYSAPAKAQEKEAESKSKSDDKKEELPSTGTASSVMSLIGAALTPFSAVLMKKKK